MSGTAAYDAIASLYDQHWGHPFASYARQAFDAHLRPVLPSGASILDLCCGTGLVLAHLGDIGYRTFGVDESSEMLAIARRNAPRAQLQQADMAGFSPPYPIDAVVSFYNSLNHARSLEHLQATLSAVARHLTAGGFFLFDYVLPEGFETGWEWCEQVDGNDNIWSLRYTYDRASCQATCLINHVDSIRQTCFPADKIRAALDEAGLALLNETPMPCFGPATGRLLLLTRKQ